MSGDPKPSFRPEQVKSTEIPPATQKVIAKLWLIHDSLRKRQDGIKNAGFLRKIIDQLHVAPLPSAQGWDSPEESWLHQQIDAGIVPRDRYDYAHDCMTSEATYKDVESWFKHLREGLTRQESEVPLLARHEKDPNGPTPYERLRKALNILPDNPNEFTGGTWIDRAASLGLIPTAEKIRYQDIFANIREKAEVYRDKERLQKEEIDQ